MIINIIIRFTHSSMKIDKKKIQMFQNFHILLGKWSEGNKLVYYINFTLYEGI